MPPRRGRGGAGLGGASRRNVPFEIDPELAQYADGEEPEDDDKDEKKEDEKEPDEFEDDLFPALEAYVMAAPTTDNERRQVQIGRELQAKRRAGPFWTGTKEDWAKLDKDANMGSRYNPFEDAPTYGKKTMKKQFKLAPLSKIKLHKEFFPKELHDVIGVSEEEDYQILTGIPPERQPPRKKLGLAKKSTLDKLAKFDDGNEDVPTAEAAEEDKEEGEKEDEDEDAEPELQDDDFEEDEDDDDNDYNAEHYFDGGDEEMEEHGGEDYDDGNPIYVPPTRQALPTEGMGEMYCRVGRFCVRPLHEEEYDADAERPDL